MTEPGTPTLDQLRVFLAVVDAGGFAAAARALGRATSVISYTIANLEDQLGVQVFDRTATRKPELTEAGRIVLAEACAVMRDVDGLRARVRGLLHGLEAELGLVVDVLLPTARLVDALEQFSARFPTVPIRLHTEALGAVMQKVLDGSAMIGILGGLEIEAANIERIAVGAVDLVPVCAPQHALAQAASTHPGAARAHLQLVLTDRSPLTEGRDFSVLSPRTWRLADLGAKHALLLAGLGWGNMPLPMVADDLAAGRLVEMRAPDLRRHAYPLTAIHRTDTLPGPAASWLIAHFRAQAGLPINSNDLI